VQNDQVVVHAKSGGEGTSVFDSAIAVLQGLFPPNSNNLIELANGTKVVTPLGGYQYIPVEMAPSGVDHALEPWTECPVSYVPLGRLKKANSCGIGIRTAHQECVCI
jgi:lysosomal acid phosphatase